MNITGADSKEIKGSLPNLQLILCCRILSACRSFKISSAHSWKRNPFADY